MFAFDPETMKRLKKKTKNPEILLYSYLETEDQPRKTTATVRPKL